MSQPDQPMLAIAGDLHLDQYNWVKHPTLCGDSHESFRQIIDYCLRKHIGLLLLGDIFENNHPDSGSVICFHQGVERLAKVRLPVYYVQGDHDLVSAPEPPWPGVHPHATHIHKQTVVLPSGLKLYGHDYQPGGMQSALETIPPGTDIFATHCGWTDCGERGATDASLKDLPASVGYVFSGHWHRYLDEGGTNGSARLLSAGSTNMRSLDEAHVKQIFVLTEAGDYYSQGLLTRPFNYLSLDTQEQLEWAVAQLLRGASTLYDNLPAVVRKPICHIRYDDWLPEAADRLKQAAGDKYHLFLDPRHNPEEVVIGDTVLDERSDQFFNGLYEGLEQFAPTDTPCYNGVRRLLDCQSPAEELNKMYQEWLETHDGQSQEDEDTSSHAHAGAGD